MDEYLYLNEVFCSGGSDVWIDEPTTKGTIVYSIVTPCISFFGIWTNVLSLVVLLRKEFKASIFTYLRVLAATDCINSAILFICGFSRGILWDVPGWTDFDALISLPLGGIFSCLAVITTVAVAIDRVVYLWDPTRCVKPRFCHRHVARKVMIIGTVVSVLFNIPYWFMYEKRYDGKLKTTTFYDSRYYAIHNWIKVAVFGIVPAIILIFGNGFLIYSLKRAYVIKEKCHGTINKRTRKNKDQRLTTVTLVAIVFFFIFSEIPATLVSRKTAVTILFGGDLAAADVSRALEILRQVATLFSAINIAANFFIYCLFCPQFRRSLADMLARRRKIINNFQLNVFVIEGFRFGEINMKLYQMLALQNKTTAITVI